MSRRGFLRMTAAAIASGGARGWAAAPAQPKELRLALATEPTSLDPHYAAIAGNIAVSQHLFEALVGVDAAGRYVPALAQSWRAVDPTTWEIKLRPVVRFHDGTQMTAEDVAWSLKRPSTIVGSPAPFTTFSAQILSAQVTDPFTLVLKTREPYGGLLGDLSSLFIVPMHVAASASAQDFESGKAVVGTGPYKLGAFKRGESLSLVRHDAHWAEATPWERVTLKFISADAPRITALVTGGVDAIEGVPPADIAKLKTSDALRVERRVSWRTIFFHVEQFTDRSPWITDKAGQPMEKSPLKDRRVRRAMSLALNRRAITGSILDGLAEPAGQLIAPGILGYSAALKPDPYDPEEAKRLLAQAGYPDGFNLTLHAPSHRYIYDEQVASVVAQLWSRVGIRTRVETLPVSAYFGRARQGEFSVAMLGYGSLAADFALRALLGTPDARRGWGTWNWSKYSNAELDAFVREALRSTDAARRAAAAAQAMEVAMRDCAVIPVHHQMSTWAMRRNVRYPGRVDEFTMAHQFRPE